MLPSQYKWLEKEKTPKMLVEALKLYGIKEFVGDKHNPIILGWANELRGFVGIPYTADETPWCGLFIGVVAKRAGLIPQHLCIRAKEWLKFGYHINNEDAALGDILVFNRNGGGHVGLYVGEDDLCYYVLGGNQVNMVCIIRIKKNRLSGVRRTEFDNKNIRKIFLKSDVEVSKNEA